MYDGCLHKSILQVRSNIRVILASPDWADIKDHNPKLANDVLEKVVTIDDPPPSKRSKLEVFYRAPGRAAWIEDLVSVRSDGHIGTGNKFGGPGGTYSYMGTGSEPKAKFPPSCATAT